MTTRRDRERMIAEGTTTVDAELAAVENKLAQAIRERDEARRLCCERAAMDESGYVKHGTMLHFAESRGWDCYKEDCK